MNIDKNKDAVRRLFIEGITKNDAAVFDELLAPDYVDHHVLPGMPRPLPNRGVFKEVIRAFHTAFPGLTLLPDGDMIGERDRVVAPFVFNGTHGGEFMGRPATGIKLSMTGIAMYRFAADGCIAEAWVQEDVHGMLTQLGFVQV